MTYIKEDGRIYKVLTTKTLVDLDALKAELADLKAMKEPDNEELAEMGKMVHPYFMDRDFRIKDLGKIISEIEKVK